MGVLTIVLHAFYLILAFVAAVAVSLFTVDSWRRCWVPVAVFIGALLALWLLHVLAICLISLFADTKKKPSTVHNFFRWVSVVTLDVFLAAAGVRFRVEGREKLPDRPFLLVCNHVSILDPLVMMVAFRDRDVAFISKKENRAIPAVSRYMVPCGCLFLDRDDSRAAVYTIRQAAEYISEGVCSMAICPEGTRNKTKDPILPFHAGSFKIAIKAGCPLVIAGVRGTQNVCRRFPFRTTPVDICLLDTVPAEQTKTARSTELARLAEREIAGWLTAEAK
ncbi:MAG: 1-acyl-sn-glycerol-3-phosphate acyltransferase [Oscillospiraceae bacterium]|nr:1-acyl-sn-glycerol-3-phosphate acyltransferase [Oscillospiraceae bacterium]